MRKPGTTKTWGKSIPGRSKSKAKGQRSKEREVGSEFWGVRQGLDPMGTW